MNTKYAVALLLALQVSVSLCEIPAPDQELVDKYNELRGVFISRLHNAYRRLHDLAGPRLADFGQTERGQHVRGLVEQLQAKPEVQAVVKVVGGVAEEASPLIDKARESLLGLYGAYIRPYGREHIERAIANARVYLDQFMPAE